MRQKYAKPHLLLTTMSIITILIIVAVLTPTETEQVVEVVIEPIPQQEIKLSAVQPEIEVKESDSSLIMYYTEEEMNYIGRLITAEAGGLSNEEMRAVAMTVLHRVDNPKWPNDIIQVINQDGQYADEDMPAYASDRALEAAFEALDQWNLAKNSLIPEEDFRLPEKFIYFFGDGRHNYFYCYEKGAVVFYDDMPNAPLPGNINELYDEIVLQRATKVEATEMATSTDVEDAAVVAEEDDALALIPKMEAQNPDEDSAEVKEDESVQIDEDGEVGHCL